MVNLLLLWCVFAQVNNEQWDISSFNRSAIAFGTFLGFRSTYVY